MALTLDQETQALAMLRTNAAAALAFIDEKTSGFWHGLISGDTGGGERTLVRVVQEDMIPSLERTMEAARADDERASEWRDNAATAEENLRQVEGYAVQGTVAQILADTAAASAQQVGDVAAAVAKPLAFGVGTGAVLVLAAVLAWHFGAGRRA